MVLWMVVQAFAVMVMLQSILSVFTRRIEWHRDCKTSNVQLRLRRVHFLVTGSSTRRKH